MKTENTGTFSNHQRKTVTESRGRPWQERAQLGVMFSGGTPGLSGLPRPRRNQSLSLCYPLHTVFPAGPPGQAPSQTKEGHGVPRDERDAKGLSLSLEHGLILPDDLLGPPCGLHVTFCSG